MDTEKLSIGEVAARAGVNVETLRYYERRGLLKEPHRHPSGHRQYPPDAVDFIRSVKRAQALGFTLDEIEEFVLLSTRKPGMSGEALSASATKKIAEIDAKIAALREMRLGLETLIDQRCDSLTNCTCGRGCPVGPTVATARGEPTPQGTKTPNGRLRDLLPVAGADCANGHAVTYISRRRTSMAEQSRWSDTIELLACDVASRPDAPGLDELRPYVTAITRETDSIVISYRPEAASLFAAFAAAEQVCCSGLGWELEEADRPLLRITATDLQLDALGVMLADE